MSDPTVRPFKSFEEAALRRLASPVLGPANVDRVLREASFIGAECSCSGYSIAVRHGCLPPNNIEFERPETIGRCDDLVVSFSAFIKENILVLSCESLGSHVIPKRFRERDVLIGPGEIEIERTDVARS